MNAFRLIFKIIALICMVSCSESHFREDKIFAGGVYATKKALNNGKATYAEYCMPCHGEKGDGKGVAAKGLAVPPRDFRLGQYKFGRVIAGELPRDEDFYKLIQDGLTGTSMLPWKELSDKQMYNLVQYIKTFAPKKWEGTDKKLGTPILPTKDPFGVAHKESAIEKGKEVYHAVGQCWTCHRAYVGHEEFSRIQQKINGAPITEFDPEMYHVKLQPTDYGHQSIPPDFTYDSVRSAKTVEELYVRISAGIAGTTMPSWRGTLQENEIWAVSHYIKYLMDLKDTPMREKVLQEANKKL